MRKWLGSSSPLWMLLQQGAGRVSIALKFLILARLLGPESIGIIGVALLAVAFVESCTELGFNQALIQKGESPTDAQVHAAWTYQLLRGIGIALTILCLAHPIAIFLNAPQGGPLIALTSVILLARNASNIAIVLAQRGQLFRKVAIFNGTFSFVDAVIGIAIAYVSGSVMTVFAAMVAVEVLKASATYMVFDNRVGLNFRRADIRETAAYGRWVWGSSLVNFVLNQLDKVVVARLLGALDMGVYQVAQRMAQMGIADAGVALGQYLFPRMSHQFRQDRKRAFHDFAMLFVAVFTVALTACMLLSLLAPLLFDLLLGPRWVAAVRPFQVMLPGMLAGVMTAQLVAFLRAEGRAAVVTLASLCQLLALLPLLYLFSSWLGMTGVALGSSLSVAVATLCMLLASLRLFPDFRAALWQHGAGLAACIAASVIFMVLPAAALAGKVLVMLAVAGFAVRDVWKVLGHSA